MAGEGVRGIMPTLVPVPWQPECLLTPATLAYLIAASNRLGTQLEIDGQDGAWRPYARQAYLYGGYINHLPGFNTASNPDTGQRNHMRGDAFDLIRTDAAAQAACRAVGLVRDSAESWHWNNPNWANDPIIPTAPGVTIAADGTYSSVLTGGFLMALSDAEQAELLNGVRNLYAAMFAGGPSMADQGRSVSQSLGGIVKVLDIVHATTAQPVQRTIDGKTVLIPQIQDNADTKTIVQRIEAEVIALSKGAAAVIDYEALAAAIVKAGGTSPSAESVAQVVAQVLAAKLGAA